VQPDDPGSPAPAAVEPGAPEAFIEVIPGTAVEIEMTPIPAGVVEVADPENPGAMVGVEIPAFFMSTTEITWDAYDVFVFALDQPDPTRPADADVVSRPSKPYLPPDRGFGHAGYPALSMTHHAAEQFCVWLSEKTGRRYRLATEDEWEHACRAGTAGEYTVGVDEGTLGEYAWHADNAEWTTHPVGTLKANAFGLFDMHGNAAEWVDGRDGEPVVCGGSYLDGAEDVTATSRQKQTRDWQASDPQIPRSRWWLSDAGHVGFRVVCEVE
jgi:formylglycine-generating enzyme required for sulfatase activity